MAIIRPFQAIRPAEGLAEKIAALPYDVYNRQEAREVALANPLSFLNIDRPETQFPEDFDMYDDQVYQKADQMLRKQIQDGNYIKDSHPSYYLYELTMDGRAQTGIVACASIDDYQNQIIKKHENTLAEKEKDRIHHVDTCSAQTGPIFLAFRHKQEITELTNKVKKKDPVYDFTSEDEITHRVWIIDDPEQVKSLQEAFSQIGQIYIADGHHRCASAVKVGIKRREEHPAFQGEEEFNYFLSVLFPDDQLKIMDYNRVVKDLAGYTPDAFLQAINKVCTVEKVGDTAFHPAHKGEVAMFLDNEWYRLTFKKPLTGDPVKDLDVSRLQEDILEPMLGIKDPKKDARINFVGGIRGLKELERRVHTDCKVAFAMYPTSITELFDVADAGRLMPPKSTWFEPKLRSGLFIHEIER